MSNINNKHIPEDLDSLTRKDMVELFKIQVEEHQGFIKEIETLRAQLAKANERIAELDEIADTAFKYNHSSAQCIRAWNKLQQLRKEQE